MANLISYFYLFSGAGVLRGAWGLLDPETMHLLLVPEGCKHLTFPTIFRRRLGGGIQVMGSRKEVGKLETSHGKKPGANTQVVDTYTQSQKSVRESFWPLANRY